MTGNVYSTYELARGKADEKLKELEQDIFICKAKYKSGEEFTLKTRDEMTCSTYLYMLVLPFKHRFKNRENAEREADIFAPRKGRPVYVEKKTEKVKGYDIIKYYYLTYKLCST